LDSECGRYFFKWFLSLKIQINSKNQVLGGKISWGHGNNWPNGTGHTNVHHVELASEYHVTQQEKIVTQTMTLHRNWTQRPWFII
jgi:hypothetical protein